MEILGLRQILVNVVTLVGVLIFVKSEKDIPIYLFIVSISLILNNFWLVVVYIKKYAKIKFQIIVAFWKELFKSSISIAGTLFLLTITTTFNVFLLSNFAGEYETGLFGASYRLFALCLLPISIIQYASIPNISKALAAKERQNSLTNYVKLLAFVGGIISAIILFFPDFFVSIIFGQKYAEATPVLQLLMIACFFCYYNGSMLHPLFAWGYERKIFRIYVIIAISNVLLNIFLISFFSEIGAALAFLISEMFLSTLFSILFFKEVKKIYIFNFLKLILFALSSCLFGYLSIKLIQNYFIFKLEIIQLIGIIISLICFISLIFYLKIIEIKDIKRIFRK
jgi:O-antigen/teichoic acid export membrane protein